MLKYRCGTAASIYYAWMGDVLLSLSSSHILYYICISQLLLQIRTGVRLSRVRMAGLARIRETPATSVCVPRDTRERTVKRVQLHFYLFTV